MFISTTTLTSSPSDLTAVGQKQEACSSIGLLARQSPSDRPLTTPSSTTLSMAIRQPNWSEADTLFSVKCYGTIWFWFVVDSARPRGEECGTSHLREIWWQAGFLPKGLPITTVIATLGRAAVPVDRISRNSRSA